MKKIIAIGLIVGMVVGFIGMDLAMASSYQYDNEPKDWHEMSNGEKGLTVAVGIGAVYGMYVWIRNIHNSNIEKKKLEEERKEREIKFWENHHNPMLRPAIERGDLVNGMKKDDIIMALGNSLPDKERFENEYEILSFNLGGDFYREVRLQDGYYVDDSYVGSPLFFEKVWLTKNSIGVPEVRTRVRNVGTKTIVAYRYEVRVSNIYGEKLNSFGMGRDSVRVLSQLKLKQNNVGVTAWTANGFDTGYTFELKVVSVLFEDGTELVPEGQFMEVSF